MKEDRNHEKYDHVCNQKTMYFMPYFIQQILINFLKRHKIFFLIEDLRLQNLQIEWV